MDTITFLVSVFCLVDDWLKDQSLRRRGSAPTLRDSEVLTIEIVGEYLGTDTDKGLFLHFRRYYNEWFLTLRQTNRTTFVRQVANLWAVKYQLWQVVLKQLNYNTLISLVDSFPVPVCRFARALRFKLVSGWAAFGKDQVAKQTFFGLRAHVRIIWPELICGISLAPANTHDVEVAPEVLEGASGWVLGGRYYWNPLIMAVFKAKGIWLLAPFKSARREKQPWPRWMTHMCYWIETVFSQLIDRFHAKKCGLGMPSIPCPGGSERS